MAKLLLTLLKIDKYLSWILLVMMVIFIITGYRLTGKYGLENIMTMRTALNIHLTLDVLLILLFLLHVGTWSYVKISKILRKRHAKKN